MREYGRVAPTFWTGETGKALQSHSQEAVIMGAYLMTCAHSNMLGLYWLPIEYASLETGLGFEGASKGLSECMDVGFCKYDPISKYVWVVEMAHYQIAFKLKEKDNRVIGIQRAYAQLPGNPFLSDWFDHYAQDFLLTERRHPKGLVTPSEAITGKARQGKAQARLLPTPDGVGVNLASETGGKDLFGEPPHVNGSTPRKRSLACPFADIVALYHEMLCPPLAMVEALSAKREGHIRARWENDLKDLESWKRYFSDVATKPFLMGRKQGSNGRKPFKANLEWLTNQSNFLKVAEGQYDE